MTISLIHCWDKNCGPDPFHTISCVSSGTTIGLFAIGFINGSTPIEVLAGISLASIGILTSRIAYLKPFSDEGRTARQIKKAAKDLQRTEEQVNNEMETLKRDAEKFRTELASSMKEKDALEKIREENVRKIQNLTSQLQIIEKTNQEGISKLQLTLVEEMKINDVMNAHEKIRSEQNASLKDIDTSLKTDSDDVKTQIDQLVKTKETIEKENSNLQKDIVELKLVIEQFKQTIKEKNCQIEVQKEKIRELKQLEEINRNLEEDTERLKKIVEESLRTPFSREPFHSSPPPAPINATPPPPSIMQ
jgi:chromosome segregation ATPase